MKSTSSIFLCYCAQIPCYSDFATRYHNIISED